MLTGAKRSKGGMRASMVLYDGKFLAVNGTNAKYQLAMIPGTSNTYGIAQVQNCAEWASIAALFEDVFVEKVVMRYVPQNKYSAISGSAGTLVNLNTGMAVIGAKQHATAGITDSASAFIQECEVQQHKIVDLGEDWSFAWRNVEKFSWDGPVTDLTTATTVQSWCPVASINKYGGYFEAFVPSVCAATGAVNTYQTAANLGVVVYAFHCHFRYRN
jgi:hypothetical protein